MKIQKLLNQWLSDQQKRKYLGVIFLCGVILMLLPSVGKHDTVRDNVKEETAFSVEDEEKRLGDILSSIQGAGKCRVLLSVQSGMELVLAEDNGETVVLSDSGTQSAITVQKRYPGYIGAVIVTEGCGSASVRYDILSAVMSYTGLGADKITICPLEE